MHIVAVTVQQNIRLNVPGRTNLITQTYVIQTVILILFWCYCYNLVALLLFIYLHILSLLTYIPI